jgi:hypothetical protein
MGSFAPPPPHYTVLKELLELSLTKSPIEIYFFICYYFILIILNFSYKKKSLYKTDSKF